MDRDTYIEALPISGEAKRRFLDLFVLGGFSREDVHEILKYIDEENPYWGHTIVFECSEDVCSINEHALGKTIDNGNLYFAKEEFRSIVSGFLLCEGFDEDEED